MIPGEELARFSWVPHFSPPYPPAHWDDIFSVRSSRATTVPDRRAPVKTN